MRVFSATLAILGIAALPLLMWCCGTEGDILGSVDYVPISGVAPFIKVDTDPVLDLIQPFVIVPEDDSLELMEPCVLYEDSRFRMWVELAEFTPPDQDDLHVESSIYYLTSRDGILWKLENNREPVLVADQEWEGRFTGGPAVIREGGIYRMWYTGGSGTGFGYAESQDGIHWNKHEGNPIMVPQTEWEDGPEGAIYAPAVVRHKDKYRMWYSAGRTRGVRIGVNNGRAIGYATSLDGIAWIRRDGRGHNSRDNGNDVHPVLSPDQEWEGEAIGSPTVYVKKKAGRTIYMMWYTGNLPGELFVDDASVGYAGSLNGYEWEKAEAGVNPVLQEIFALSFEGITEYLLYDEAQPTVLKRDDLYMMWFVQKDAMNVLSSGLWGVALATNPPVNQ